VAFKLNQDPNWHAAASDLVNGLNALQQADEQVRLLEKICDSLGDELYPAFLQILFAIEQYAERDAQQLFADTLVNCLRTGRLPSGKLSAWGSASLTGDSAFGQTRVLGPIEYVCAWYAQGNYTGPLSVTQLHTILSSMMKLVSTSDAAKSLYCQKLQGDIEDPLGGALSNQTRAGLQELIDLWIHSDNIADAVDAFLSTLHTQSPLSQIAKGPLDTL